MKKKVLAFALVLCMAIAMLPVSVFAAPAGGRGALVGTTAVGELEPAAVEPNAKSYSVKISKTGKGTVELMVDSPAKVGSEVYFLADPDDGYLANIYCEGVDPEDVVYLGAEVYGFVMPSNKVTLKVEFVAAEGSSHSISVYEEGSGDYELSRTSAKQFESVLLAVRPRYSSGFDPEQHVWISGADGFFLLEQAGVYYYEIFMDSQEVKIFINYNVSATLGVGVGYEGDPFGGTAKADKTGYQVGDLVTVIVSPNPGFRVVGARGTAFAGNMVIDLTPIGNNCYTFIMPPCSVFVDITFRSELMNVTVNAGPGGTAYTNVTKTKVATSVFLTCVPDENYRVDKITGVEGLEAQGNNVYHFVMPARDVVINVTFKAIYNPVTVTVENGLGGSAITNVLEAKAGDTVNLTCTPAEGYRLARITGVKELTDNGDGTYTFIMPDHAADIRVLFLRHENPFFDVNETQFFYESVLWAVKENITSGISATEFGPFAVCNRAQVVTFLWRYAGSPEPVSAENPFTDVPEGSFYHKAVLWAVENGITKGVSDTAFGPGLACNRAQVVTFLWRMMKEPTPTLTENPFTDVDPGWYELPVLWALENGITTGATADTFNPAGECQRAQVVTFLYRTAQLPPPPAVYALDARFDAEQGTVTLSHSQAQAGELITATVIPAEGWQIETVSCLSGAEITAVSDTEYTFVMPESEETVCVTFTAISAEPEI